MSDDVCELKSITKEMQSTLTGKGDAPGVVGNIALLRQRMAGLEAIINNDLKHMSAKFDLMLSSRDMLTAAKQKDVVTKGDILKDWVKPVITSIVTAILLYFIITNGIAQ